jgi:hypothetical protein
VRPRPLLSTFGRALPADRDAHKPSSTAPNSSGVQKSSTRPSSEPSVKSTVSQQLSDASDMNPCLSRQAIAARTGVVSFLKNGRSIFDCHPLEKSRLIFQLGSASPELAVQAMKVIQHDVAGVGLNCGCPKSFSLSGGMGAALLKEPEKLCSVRPSFSPSFCVQRTLHDSHRDKKRRSSRPSSRRPTCPSTPRSASCPSPLPKATLPVPHHHQPPPLRVSPLLSRPLLRRRRPTQRSLSLSLSGPLRRFLNRLCRRL